jgi:N-acetylglucosamine kinase-like BadF-type ATPase
MSDLFLGVDAGGSTTRALLTTEDGEVVGAGRGGGANRWSSGTSVSEVIAAAVREALDDVDPGRVAVGVVAMAGSLTSEDVAADVLTAWRILGLPRSPRVVSDVLTGFAAGTTAEDGSVLVAGTGSIAAAIRGREVRKTSGGHGWLLGDEGSAVWLGLEGIRAALRALDGRGPGSRLADTVPAALGITDLDAVSTVIRVVRAAHDRPPARLGQLAPVVLDAATAGDEVAQALADAAADHLVGLVDAVIEDGGTAVIVLSGSLLTDAAPIGGRVRTRLMDRWPMALLAEARSGEAGAVALAIERHRGAPVDEATLLRLRAGASLGPDASSAASP